MKKKVKKLKWFFLKNGNIVIIVSEPFTVSKKGKFITVKTKK